MAFLRVKPVVSLAGPGQTQTFIADVFQSRPAFDEIVRSSNAWCNEAVEKMRGAMSRKNCAVTWVQLVIDQHGLLAILRYEHPLALGDAKKAASVILRCLPQEQRCAAEQSLRPMDEVDRNRIQAWQTVESLRPAGKKRAREEEAQVVVRFVRPGESLLPSPAPAAKSVAEFLAEESSSEEELAPPRLMLTNGSARVSAEPNLSDPTSVWEYRAKSEATVIVAEVGERPAQLAYIRCHREPRRQMLLQSKVREEWERPTMPQVIKTAMQLAKDGSFPNVGEHGRKSEFIKRCATALQAIDPSIETDLKKLSAEEQAIIRQALGGDVNTPYDGCLSAGCLGDTTTWEVSNLALSGEPFIPMSRCTVCKCPKVFGRTVQSIGDILRDPMARDLARKRSGI